MILAAMDPGLFSRIPLPDLTALQSFKTMFISIVLEAFPFILLGVLVSSCMQTLIPEQWVRRFVPRNPLLGILFACLLGILFPVCECGLIPVIRRLIAKGMPLYVGVVFILVGPIVNPIVYAATYTAFRTRPEMVYARMGLALAVGLIVGLIVYAFVSKNQLKHSAAVFSIDEHDRDDGHRHNRSKLISMLEHAGSEFIEMGKFLMFGAVATAAIQAFLPRGNLVHLGQGAVMPHIFMMGLAYVLSLCSTSDAFVATSFIGTFSAGSLLTFLVFGPMLDFKSTLMLFSVFKTRFVCLLAVLVAVTVLGGAMAAEHLLPNL
ncbi:permease [Paenibacillus thalictri]|uniref:Permease n=2 Tax=Paenibacillus thalictri TaxID=2527873 RepID=A0A4Q9DFT0_9BACL|nr:permease [Paenibacillus thalictri]